LPSEYFDSYEIVEKIENYISNFEVNYNDLLNSKLLSEIKPSLMKIDKKSKTIIIIILIYIL